MSLYLHNSAPTLRMLIRNVPVLAREDSIESFVRAVRGGPYSETPVQQNGRLCGVVSLEDAISSVSVADSEARTAALRRPLSDIMREPPCVARPGMTVAEVGALCSEFRRASIPVADDDDLFIGVILACDILVPGMTPAYPRPVGGMATPFGVYLTHGSARGGVGDWALVASGMALAVLSLAAGAVVRAALIAAGGLFPLLRSPGLTTELAESGAHHAEAGLASLTGSLLIMTVFLVALRATRLASYHAAEHQTVHAMERNEELVPEIVGRMPRVHPRCGTNLLAAGMTFELFQHLLAFLPALDGMSASLGAAAAAAILWRRVGGFIQQHFTTRPAGERELRSGIAAATALIQAYYQSPPSRVPRLRRLWCSGLPQTAFGMLLVFGVVAVFFGRWLQ